MNDEAMGYPVRTGSIRSVALPEGTESKGAIGDELSRLRSVTEELEAALEHLYGIINPILSPVKSESIPEEPLRPQRSAMVEILQGLTGRIVRVNQGIHSTSKRIEL